MSNGVISTSGQNFLLRWTYSGIINNGGLYVGLMTNNIPLPVSGQTPTAIHEVTNTTTTCSGYERKLCNSWTFVSGVNPHLIGSGVQFSVSGNWSNVNGYFTCLTKTGNVTNGDYVLWSELFPPDKGVIASGNPIIVSPIFYQS